MYLFAAEVPPGHRVNFERFDVQVADLAVGVRADIQMALEQI